MTTEQWLTGCSGFSFKALRGEIYQIAMERAETVSGRFYYWRKTGLWQRVLEALQQQADAQGNLNWEIHHVDSVSSVLTNMQQGHSWGN